VFTTYSVAIFHLSLITPEQGNARHETLSSAGSKGALLKLQGLAIQYNIYTTYTSASINGDSSLLANKYNKQVKNQL
jgi:hypothetical protein